MEVFQHRCWLGHGSYGDVQLCEIRPQTAALLLGPSAKDAEQVSGPILIALKTWKQAHKDGKVMRIALREAQILKLVTHPNIIKLRCTFQTPSGRVCMAFEYGGKSSHQLMESRFPRGIPHPLLQRLAFQMVHALRYLHARRIVHRDVKPANILVDSAGVLRLCDFGFARQVPGSADEVAVEVLAAAATDDSSGSGNPLTPYVITRWYRAPEVLLGMPYGIATDIWSLGCSLAELATGEPLLPGTSSLDQIARIRILLGPLPSRMVGRAAAAAASAGKAECVDAASAGDKQQHSAYLAAGPADPADALRRRLGSRLPPQLVELLAACLRTDPWDRPTAEELLQMPYFADAAQLFAGTSLGHIYGCELEGAATPPPPLPPPHHQHHQQVATVTCRHHWCPQHPPRHHLPYQQHKQHKQQQPSQRRRTSHQHHYRNPQRQEPHDMFRSDNKGLPYNYSISSSADASTAASCSEMSASGGGAVATVTATTSRSITDSLYSTAALSSSCCSCYCDSVVGRGGIASSDVTCLCLADPADLGLSGPEGTQMAAAVANCPTAAAGGSGRGGDDAARAANAAACWHATAVSSTCKVRGGLEPLECRRTEGEGPSEPAAAAATPPPGQAHHGVENAGSRSLMSPSVGAVMVTAAAAAAVAGPARPAVTGAWSDMAPQMGYREAAIRAMAAAAAFAAGEAAEVHEAANAAAAAAAKGWIGASGELSHQLRDEVAWHFPAAPAAAPRPAATVTGHPSASHQPHQHYQRHHRHHYHHHHHHHHQQQQQQQLQLLGSSTVRRSVESFTRRIANVTVMPSTSNNETAVPERGNGGGGSSNSSSNSSERESSSRVSTANCGSEGSSSSSSGFLPPDPSTTGLPPKFYAVTAAPTHPAAAAAVAAASSDAADGCAAGVMSKESDPWVCPASLQPWRPTAAAISPNEDTHRNGRDVGGAACGSTCGGVAAAAAGPSAGWLYAYYQKSSPDTTAAVSATEEAACAASRLTTMSFNWHCAESPLDVVARAVQDEQGPPGPLHHLSNLMGGAWPLQRRLPQQPLQPRPWQQPPRRVHHVRLYDTRMAAVGEVLDGVGHDQAAAALPPPPPVRSPQQQADDGRAVATLLLVSSGIWPQEGADDLPQEGSRPQVRHAAEPRAPESAAVATATTAAAAAAGGTAADVIWVPSNCDESDGCRPMDLTCTWTTEGFRRGCESCPGGKVAAAADARGPEQGRTSAWAEAAVAAAMASNPVRVSCDIGCLENTRRRLTPGRGSGAAGERTMHAAVMVATVPGTPAAARPAVAQANPLARAAAIAGAAAAAARSVIVAAERGASVAFSLDTATGARSYRTSIGEHSAAAAALEADSSAAGGGGGTSNAVCSGGTVQQGGSSNRSCVSLGRSRGVRAWLRKSRVWLRSRLEGGGLSWKGPQTQPC